MEEFAHVTDLVIARKKLPQIMKAMKKPIDEITDFCLNLREFIEFPEIKIVEVPEKCMVVAQAALKAGYRLHKEGKNVQAIESFNTGIISGDFKTKTDCAPKENVVALSYAGRSAASFELARYNECLKDINRAIEHGCPPMFIFKLKERQARCLIALRRDEEADKVIEDCLLDFANLKLGSSAPESRASLQELKLRSKTSDLKEAGETDKDLSGLDVFPPYDLPLMGDSHPDIPSLSSAVDLSVSRSKGRYLRAKRDINPGDIILSEEIYASVHYDKLYKTNCSYCLSKTNFPIPCPTCDLVVFCCEECRTSALENFHSIECKILPTLSNLSINDDRLALRIVIKAGLASLRECIPKYSSERLNTPLSKYGFNENSIYSSRDYKTIYNLATNLKEKEDLVLWHRCIIANLLLRLLEKSSFFNDEKPSIDDRKLIFHALLTHLLSADVNCYDILLSSLDPKGRIMYKNVGKGISSVYGLIGHSCESNTVAFSFPSITIARAVEFIPKGTEITVTYGDNRHGFKTLQERQRSLSKGFDFQCKCQACLEQWPHERSHLNNIVFDTVCKEHLRLRIHCPPECPVSEIRGKLSLIYDVFTLLEREIRPIEYIEYKIEEYKEVILKMCKYAKLPCADLMHCKDAIRYEYNRLGYIYYSNNYSTS